MVDLGEVALADFFDDLEAAGESFTLAFGDECAFPVEMATPFVLVEK